MGTIGHRARSSGFCGGARARGIQGQCPGRPVRSGQKGLFRLPFDSRAVSVLSLLPPSLIAPSVDFFHFRHSGSSVHSSFLMCVLVLHPTLTPSSLPPFLRQEPCTILGLSWLLVACPSPLPFHLQAPHSPILCRSSLLGFFLLFVLCLPHTLSHLLIPFFPALLSSLPHLHVVKDHSLEGIASTSNVNSDAETSALMWDGVWEEPTSGEVTVDTSALEINTGCYHNRHCFPHQHQHKQQQQDSPGGPVVKSQPCNAGNVHSVSAQGTKSPHAVEELSSCTATREPVGHSKRFRMRQLRSGMAK